METKGWKSFWTALWVTLLALVPLVAGTAFWARRQAAQRLRASESQSGVPIAAPRAENHLTLLACVAGEQPAFVLLYLSADGGCIHLLAVPGQLTVPFGQGQATLACRGCVRWPTCPRTPITSPRPPTSWPPSRTALAACGWAFRAR